MAEADVDVQIFFVNSWGSFKFVHDRRKANRMAKQGKSYCDDIRWIPPKRRKHKALLHNGRKAHG